MAENGDKPKIVAASEEEVEELEGKTEGPGQIPEKWQKLDFEGLAEEGWRPHVKTQGGHEYIYLRYRKAGEDRQKSLGRYSGERWQYIQKLFAPKGSINTPVSQSISPSPLMRSAIVKMIPSSVRFTAEVMQWYWWAAEKAQTVLGKELTFEEFLNDTVLSYFAEKNMYLAVQIGVSDQSVGIQ